MYLFLDKWQFFEQCRNFVSLARSIMSESLQEETHRSTTLTEKVVDAIANLSNKTLLEYMYVSNRNLS